MVIEEPLLEMNVTFHSSITVWNTGDVQVMRTTLTGVIRNRMRIHIPGESAGLIVQQQSQT